MKVLKYGGSALQALRYLVLPAFWGNGGWRCVAERVIQRGKVSGSRRVKKTLRSKGRGGFTMGIAYINGGRIAAM